LGAKKETAALYRFEHIQILQADRPTIQKFFSDVAQLDGSTPSFFRVELLEGEPGGKLREGQVFRYRFKLFGLPFYWVTEIDRVSANGFMDSQARGPYKSFHHTHAFYDVADGTLMVDRVEYSLSYGPLSPLVNNLAVAPMLRAIFRFRAARAREMFGEAPLQ
jgi:ligand-binding SRPBCC domain-containing protein